MAKSVLGFLILCSVVCSPARSARAGILTRGSNWLLDLHWQASGEPIDDHRLPLDVGARHWRTAWTDPETRIRSGPSGFYELSAATTVDRYRFILAGRRGHFSPKEATRSFFGSDRLEVDLSLGYRLVPTLVAFGGWRIIHYEYEYENPETSEGEPRSTAKPTYAGFHGGLLLAIPLRSRVVPFYRISVCRLAAEGDYAPVAGVRSEWGVAFRPVQIPLTLLVSHQKQRLKTQGESARGTDERFSGMTFGFSYVFRVETADTWSTRRPRTR